MASCARARSRTEFVLDGTGGSSLTPRSSMPTARRRAALLLALPLLAATAGAAPPPDVTVSRPAGRIRVATDAAVVDVNLGRLRWKLRSTAPRRVLAREPMGGGLFYERGGT